MRAMRTCGGERPRGGRSGKRSAAVQRLPTPSLPRPAQRGDIAALQASAGNAAVAALLQRAPTGSKGGKNAPPDEAARSIEDVWRRLGAFSKTSTPQLAAVAQRIEAYLARYDRAFEVFSGRLSAAQKDAATQSKWPMILIGIIVSTGVGLAAAELYLAATALQKVVSKLTASTASAGVRDVLSPPGPGGVTFSPPPEAAADRVARGYLDQLAKAWQSLAVVQAAMIEYGPRRDAIRDAARGVGGPRPKGAPPITGPTVLVEARQLSESLAAAEGALTLFVTNTDTPMLGRSQDTIERDLWVRWMASSEANAGTLRSEGQAGKRMRETGVPSRLGDRYSLDAATVRDLSKAEVDRLEHIGRIGVVVVPPKSPPSLGRKIPGAVHVRPDAYTAAGRRAAPNLSGSDYVKIIWQPSSGMRTGEVVLLEGTDPQGMVPQRLRVSLPVSRDEQKAGRELIGERTDWASDAVERLQGVVGSAVGGMSDVRPPLAVQEHEDGMLVVEADGTRLVLVTLYTSWGDGMAAAKRTGARRVLALYTKEPGSTMTDFSDETVVVTSQGDASSIERHIRAVRALLGKGPRITVAPR